MLSMSSSHQALQEGLSNKGPAIEELVNSYSTLTQHDVGLCDPVVKAVKDDWEELMGRVDNLIEERYEALQASRELQERQNQIDEDLDKYARELERIEREEAMMAEKAAQLKVRMTFFLLLFKSLDLVNPEIQILLVARATTKCFAGAT